MRCETFDSSFDAMWIFNSNFDTKYSFSSNVWGVVKKLVHNLIFLENFDSKHVFFRNNALRNKLSKKVGKRQLWHFNGVNWQKKRFFESKLSKKAWYFETSFMWNCVALSKFPFKADVWWKICFKISHSVKSPLQKLTSCVKLTKNCLFLKILIRI